MTRHNQQSALKDKDLIQNLKVVFPQNDISIILVLGGDTIVVETIALIVAMVMVMEEMEMVTVVMATVAMAVATVVATVEVVMEEVEENENSSTVP